MPELPEVETTRRGIEPHITHQRITAMDIRQPKLRWPIPQTLAEQIHGAVINKVQRRGKYLLVEFDMGTMLIHLGMSGSLRILELEQAHVIGKHDHVDWILNNEKVLRFTDPRRFGAVLWQPKGSVHELLASLGPEPLSDAFTADYLYQRCEGKRSAIKTVIMDSHIVVGVGNIYANEALFMAGIDPRRAAGKISKERIARLVDAIRLVLGFAIEQGGTTLKDFVGGDGKPGYFRQELRVYGRAGLPCTSCQTELKEVRLGQRSTVFCPHCQH